MCWNAEEEKEDQVKVKGANSYDWCCERESTQWRAGPIWRGKRESEEEEEEGMKRAGKENINTCNVVQ